MKVISGESMARPITVAGDLRVITDRLERGETDLDLDRLKKRLTRRHVHIYYEDVFKVLLGLGIVAAMILALIRLARWALG